MFVNFISVELRLKKFAITLKQNVQLFISYLENYSDVPFFYFEFITSSRPPFRFWASQKFNILSAPSFI